MNGGDPIGRGFAPTRRALLAGAATLWPALALGQNTPRRAADDPPPVVFVQIGRAHV